MKTLQAIESRLVDCVMMRREYEVQYRIFLAEHQARTAALSETESMLERLKKVELDELQKRKDAIPIPAALDERVTK